MADTIVRLCPGLPNPYDVRLCDPTQPPTHTYLYTGSGVIAFAGAAVTQFVPGPTGGWFISPQRKEKRPEPVTHRYRGGGVLHFYGSAPALITNALVWESVIEAAWPTIEPIQKAQPRTRKFVAHSVVFPMEAPSKPRSDDDEILLLFEALE